MADPAPGDTVYVTAWSGRNCGPDLATEYSATVIDNDYEPTDADRAAVKTSDFQTGQRHALVGLHSGESPHMIVTMAELRTEPSPRARCQRRAPDIDERH